MNRIVKEHYPASRLPEDLRQGVDPAAIVTVTIVEEEATSPEKILSMEEIWALRAPPFRTAQEIDADLRRQRDEWDD
jgi:hypothetical protein